MPGNYNAVGGFGFNPYDPRPDPREATFGRPVLQTGGSSSGIGPRAYYYNRITLNGDPAGTPDGINPTTGVTAGAAD